MLLLVIVGTIPILIGFNKLIPRNLYPLTIFVISISLLFHSSLISPYIWGGDILGEFYYAGLTLNNSLWNYDLVSNVNAMLSIVILPAIFSNVCDIRLEWVFKIIYPILYSLVPLGIFQICKKQFDERLAFFSAILFMFSFSFYTEMIMLARQQIAELFLVLIILLMLSKNITKNKRSILIIIFGWSLIVSHYGLSYVSIFCLFIAWLFLFFSNSKFIYVFRNIFKNYHTIKHETNSILPHPSGKKYGLITPYFIFILAILALTWYTFASQQSPFLTIINTGRHILINIEDLFQPEAVQPVAILLTSYLPTYEITKYLHIFTMVLLLLGIFASFFKFDETVLDDGFFAISLAFFILLAACTVLPFFAVALQTSRFYHISQIVLAPFSIIGISVLMNVLYRLVVKNGKK
jgi:uncharacterized membrane protein